MKETEETVAEKTRENPLTPVVTGIPGVGLGIASVFIAYPGDGSRCSTPGEVAGYAGFAPRVDCPGDTNRYGSIARHGYCRPIRPVVLESVRSIRRRNYGGPLAVKFRSPAARMNKRKSAAAIARKPVTPAWLLMKRREYYNGIDPMTLANKLRYYRVGKREPAA